MRIFSHLSFVLSLALSLSSASADPHAHQGRWHHAKRQTSDLSVRAPGDAHLYKRFDGARFTYYADGLGACGKTNAPGDFIVALNSAQFGGGGDCFKSITITVNGKTTGAQIVDECPGCPFGGLDMSQGLFDFFASESVGVLYGSWWFDGQAPPPPPPPPTWQPPPPPSTTWQPPPPSTTWAPPPPSTTWSPPPSSDSSSSSSSSPSSSSISSLSSSVPSLTTSASAAPAETVGAVAVTVADTSNIYDLNLAIVYLAAFLTTHSASE
ncbi:hypothetical protein BV22DRAFT_1013080 [Leucogyrophana mollusca]|uniref:Uncharacterized protein n=1 Tax=Leucogyrophana mollusca TaxID=85980 RepID=A0ACB8BH25_9AGAM|nr:hypothetical protein BV22DRAFT_1013080 [Leucogyrophana mollusca]